MKNPWASPCRASSRTKRRLTAAFPALKSESDRAGAAELLADARQALALEKMRDALQAAGNTKCDFVVYPDTPHAFHADYRPNYRKGPAEDGWKRAVAWFKSHGVA